jgi:phenylacetate-coenzyme A ligase PaaK-like adenylate-forming protein
MDPTRYYNPAEELLERQPLQQLQRQKLARLLQEITGPNRFYTRKFAGIWFVPARDPLE